MTKRFIKGKNRECGFTLIELLIVIAVLATVTGGIFLQLNTAQQRLSTEQVKVDNFDEARDFVDQFFRDINQIGYPNGHMVNFLSPTLTTAQQDTRVAVGLVKIDGNAIWFEGEVGGTGVVQSVNDALAEQPELVNRDPYGEGWMFEVRCADPSEIDALLDASGYRRLVEG